MLKWNRNSMINKIIPPHNYWRSLILLLAILCLTNSSSAGLPVTAGGQQILTLAPLIEKVVPTVVHIEVQATIINRRRLPYPFREFFQAPRPQEQQRSGAGSGVIINAAKGLLITNNHVINKADNIIVTLNDGRRLEAKVIGTDPETDIAVLKIEADDIQAITIGNSETLRVGDFVLAIGNPFGLEQSVTSGIVSALGRSGLGIESYEDFIQTDASINPGNSGGALIDLAGNLIGINTAILGSRGGSAGSIGIGFAIPVNMAMEITEQLIQYGSVKRGRLGVAIQSLTPDLAEAFNVKQTRGALITHIQKNSVASEVGLMPGDIVLSINDKVIKNAADMRNYVGLLRVDTRIALTILRDDNEMKITATIRTPKKTRVDGGNYSKRLSGILLQTVNKDDEPYLQDGLLVLQIHPSSHAYRAGLREKDLIVAANRKNITSIDDLEQSIKKKSDPILLNIQRGQRGFFIIIK